MAQIPMNKAKSLGLTALRSMIIDGRDNVVTAIINDNTFPTGLFKQERSAIGIVPKISAYTGMPTKVAKITQRGYHSQARTLPVLRNPVMNKCTYANTN